MNPLREEREYAVQEALRWLSKRRLLSIQRAGITAIPVYTVRRPWAR